MAKVLHFVDAVPARRPALAEENRLTAKGIDDEVRAHYAANVVPDLRRAAWEAEQTVADIATRRVRLCRVEFDKSDIAAALLRQEMRAPLCAMSQGERVAAINENLQFREAAFEGPAMLSELSEETRSELKRRIVREAQPQAAARLDEAEEAVTVAYAAINMVAGALKTEGGFEGSDLAFDDWMATSSAAVEREIAAASARVSRLPSGMRNCFCSHRED